ncbi:MAG: PucR family transcriptional regulator [Actinomycetota bacterium]
MTESKTSAKTTEATAGADTQARAAAQPELERQAITYRRMVLVSGNGSDPSFEQGDIAVLDRKSIGRKTLTKLVETLAKANATGLVLNDDVLSDLPIRERDALAEKLPLLVLGPEHASTQLLDEPPAPAERPTAVLRAILRGDDSGEQAAGIDLSIPTRAVVINVHPDQHAPLPIAKLEDLVSGEAHAADPRAVVVKLDGMIVSLVHDYNGGEHVEAMARTILHRARSSLLVSRITAGIGRAYPGAEGLRRAYREALWAANASELLWGGDRVTTFRELGIYGMLEPFVADPDSADTADIEKLLEHDTQGGGALLPTVEMFFKLTSVGETASALYVHRNTVSYRLRAVRRITGLDVLGDPEARVYLEVQMRLARLRGLLPPEFEQPPAEQPKKRASRSKSKS